MNKIKPPRRIHRTRIAGEKRLIGLEAFGVD
jgi:hypothetical protein